MVLFGSVIVVCPESLYIVVSARTFVRASHRRRHLGGQWVLMMPIEKIVFGITCGALIILFASGMCVEDRVLVSGRNPTVSLFFWGKSLIIQKGFGVSDLVEPPKDDVLLVVVVGGDNAVAAANAIDIGICSHFEDPLSGLIVGKINAGKRRSVVCNGVATALLGRV